MSGFNNGWLAERLKALAWKARERGNAFREFESCAIRQYGRLVERLMAPASKAGERESVPRVRITRLPPVLVHSRWDSAAIRPATKADAASSLSGSIEPDGGRKIHRVMAERLMAPVLKTGRRKRLAGSNPAHSAKSGVVEPQGRALKLVPPL
jgi:hypothetical protein